MNGTPPGAHSISTSGTSNLTKIYAVLQAILRWGHLWKGHQVIFQVENTAVVSALSVGTIQNTQWIIMLAAQLSFSYSSSWIASAHNSLADAASHFEYNQ